MQSVVVLVVHSAIAKMNAFKGTAGPHLPMEQVPESHSIIKYDITLAQIRTRP